MQNQTTRTPNSNGTSTDETPSYQPYVADRTDALKKAKEVIKKAEIKPETKKKQRQGDSSGCGCW